MKTFIQSSIRSNQTLLLFAFEKEVSICGLGQAQNLMALAAAQGFKAKENQSTVLHPKKERPAQMVIVVGLGERAKFETETLRRAASVGVRKAQALSQQTLAVVAPNICECKQAEARAILEGACLANYKFLKYKSQKENSLLTELHLIADKKIASEYQKAQKQADAFCDAVCLTRDLVNEPPSHLTPTEFARIATQVAKAGKSSGIRIQIFNEKKIKQLKMGSLLGVARGSAEPPVFIHLHYKPAVAKKSIALVGKGVTFDSGGLSLKPAQSMETMKMDMAGAASILGVFQALAVLKPNVEVHGILAVTENMPGGRANKPGDIFRAMNGKTIEVLNTDAEGRLILADALVYASNLKTDVMIDLATLTGACIVALGSLVAGVMGNSPVLIEDILKASKKSGEQFCALPLVKEYRDSINSPIADLKNISSVRGEAGSLIGGLFLQEFVTHKNWAHLDIAGPAWSGKDYLYYCEGGTGFPVRTLLHYVKALAS